MNQLFQQLIIRKEILSNLMITIRENENNLPEGKLRISNDKGNLHYYYITEPSDTHGKYIPTQDMDIDIFFTNSLNFLEDLLIGKPV